VIGSGLGVLLVLAWAGAGGISHPQPLTVAAIKAGAYAATLGLVLLAAERRELWAMGRALWASLREQPLSAS